MVAERGSGRGVFEDITETIGNTPVVKINDRMCPKGRTIYAKCEYFNPLSSVKVPTPPPPPPTCGTHEWKLHPRRPRSSAGAAT